MGLDNLPDQYRALFSISEARRAIELAQLRSASFDALMLRLVRIDSDPQYEQLIFAISELKLTPEQGGVLASIVGELLAKADTAEALTKRRIERAVGRAAEALSVEEAYKLARLSLAHRRKARRDLGFRLWRRLEVSEEDWQFFVERYRATADLRFLKYALRKPPVAAFQEFEWLLAEFEGDE